MSSTTDTQIKNRETICAPATPRGRSALGMVRITGSNAINILSEIFVNSKGQKSGVRRFMHAKTKHGYILDAKEEIVDEVVCVVFKAPKSFTGEDLVEISHHGSVYVQQQILLSILAKGGRIATNGEFSQRAFINGKMDLSQAEAVADLISAKTAMAHKLAMQQLRGGYKFTIKKLRECLVKILSLMELELDFSEEDVEFADRSELEMLLNISIRELNQLVNSFKAGNSFKNGIPVAIIGKPNSGKSTLLNRILNEERSIVSSVSGTTRDTIEESMQIDGLEFRFIDTAGIRQTKNNIETKGIERSYKAVERAEIVLYVCDITKTDTLTAHKDLLALDKHVSLTDKKIFVLANKIDLVELTNSDKKEWDKLKAIQLSASTGLGIGELLQKIVLSSGKDEYESNVLVTNVRHYEIMMKTLAALLVAKESLEAGQPTDIIVSDIREAIHYIGEITGVVTTDEILNNIFSKFCIGK